MTLPVAFVSSDFQDNCLGLKKKLYILLMAMHILHTGKFKHIKVISMVHSHSYQPYNHGFENIQRKVTKAKVFNYPDDYWKVVGKGNIEYEIKWNGMD